ncbi:MAG: hypothetical protein JWR44_765 [Hymenobacter sp.]|jgi:uncharacterized membrane protein YcaP (DUF421 family)|nr:hypothetical protein [Hymenobacter sp.]
MHGIVDTLIGLDATSHTITALQMAVRMVVVFFVALVLLRITGKRIFAANTSFDIVVKIMLGAVLSRAVVAASPFWGTLLAGLVLVALRQLLAWASFHSRFVGRLVKGSSDVVVEHGEIKTETLARNNLSREDLIVGLREHGGVETLDEAETVRLERDGSISVVKKQE